MKGTEKYSCCLFSVPFSSSFRYSINGLRFPSNGFPPSPFYIFCYFLISIHQWEQLSLGTERECRQTHGHKLPFCTINTAKWTFSPFAKYFICIALYNLSKCHIDFLSCASEFHYYPFLWLILASMYMHTQTEVGVKKLNILNVVKCHA